MTKTSWQGYRKLCYVCVCVCLQTCPQRACTHHCLCQLWAVSQTGLCLCAGSSTVSCCPAFRAFTSTRWQRGASKRWANLTNIFLCPFTGCLFFFKAWCVFVTGLQVCPESYRLWRTGSSLQRRGENKCMWIKFFICVFKCRQLCAVFTLMSHCRRENSKNNSLLCVWQKGLLVTLCT